MKNKNNNVDLLLKKAMNNCETPDKELIQKVKLKIMEEESTMKLPTKKATLRTAVAAVLVLLLVTTTAFAAWTFLSPSEVADQMDYAELAEAFRGEDAILVNETQSDNGYDVSFLGIVSGKGLVLLDSSVDVEKTYAVVAIQKQDGTMPEINTLNFGDVPFFVSPLIKGQKPWLYNIASMAGGYTNHVVDGVMYRLIECDSLEMFADRGLSLIVSSTDFYDINAYNYDESTGLVTPNPNFDGVNLVFDLPLNPEKGDFEKAQKYLDTLWDNNGNDADEDTSNQGEYIDQEISLLTE